MKIGYTIYRTLLAGSVCTVLTGKYRQKSVYLENFRYPMMFTDSMFKKTCIFYSIFFWIIFMLRQATAVSLSWFFMSDSFAISPCFGTGTNKTIKSTITSWGLASLCNVQKILIFDRNWILEKHKVLLWFLFLVFGGYKSMFSHVLKIQRTCQV